MATGNEENNMFISADEIIHSLEPLNNTFFHITDLQAYANKLLTFGKNVYLRKDDSELLSYIFYYDDGPEVFITMVWTNPKYQGQGLATGLLKQLIGRSTKDILLEVNKDNPARLLYEKMKFVLEKEKEQNVVMRYSKRLAIMQPYVFPYVGYFHLIEASAEIVFYDDVNYIKSGWINRNRILLNGRDHMFTIPLENASSFRPINQTVPLITGKFREKLSKLIQSAYSKAPYYKEVSQIISSVFNKDYANVSDLAIASIVSVYDYLGKEMKYKRSSICSPATINLDKAERLLEITKDLGYQKYINLPGGKKLYDKGYFESNHIELYFVESENITYKQFSEKFIPGLSIIDMLMFCDKKTVQDIFARYTIV